MTAALAGKLAFVAGASRGIGATVAAALAREGAAVAVAAPLKRWRHSPCARPRRRRPGRGDHDRREITACRR
jgi:NAD(P)-dependent dehydrogenase (short-subunit alcohol dehydrogenase family)